LTLRLVWTSLVRWPTRLWLLVLAGHSAGTLDGLACHFVRGVLCAHVLGLGGGCVPLLPSAGFLTCPGPWSLTLFVSVWFPLPPPSSFVVCLSLSFHCPTALLAVLFAEKQVGSHVIKDGVSNFVINPLQNEATDQAVDALGMGEAVNAYNSVSSGAAHYARVGQWVQKSFFS